MKTPDARTSLVEPVAPPQPVPGEVQPPPAAEARVVRGTSVPTGSRDQGASSSRGRSPTRMPPQRRARPRLACCPDHYDPLTADNGSGGTFGKVGTALGLPIYTAPGVLPDLPRAAAAPTEAPRARAVPTDMGGHRRARCCMAANDKKKGFDFPSAGNVNSAAIGAVQVARDAPDTAKVSFEVRLGPNGKVLGVRVVTFNGGSAGVWDQVARAYPGRPRQPEPGADGRLRQGRARLRGRELLDDPALRLDERGEPAGLGHQLRQLGHRLAQAQVGARQLTVAVR